MWLLWRLLINAAALWAATRLVPGMSFDGELWLLLVVALIFGAINASVRPVLKLLTLPLLIVTLGLFTFVLNALMLWLTGAISDGLDLGFHVAGFTAAFIGALVVTAISFVLSLFVRPGRSARPARDRNTIEHR
jgi:putative membrane protein